MDQALVTDLKQFITTVVVEHTASLRSDIRLDIRHEVQREIRRLDEKIDKLDKRMDDLDIKLNNAEVRLESKIDSLSAAVAEALNDSHDAIEARLTV
jgi:flagellar capping protein FliD